MEKPLLYVRLSTDLGGLIGNIIIPKYQLVNTRSSQLCYASIKKLGVKVDAKQSVLLVSSYEPNIKNSYKGMVGKLYCIRGDERYVLISNMWDIICSCAYNQWKFQHSGNGLKCGKCIYQGVNYVAVQLGGGSSFDYFFNGIYSPGCLFKEVLEEEVEWIE